MSNVWLPTGDHQEKWGLTLHKERMEDAGPFTGGGWKLCWHTTEGPTLGGALSALRSKRAASHVVINPRSGDVVQLIPFDCAARSLAHTLAPETNRANVIQVEIVGHASESGHWSNREYRCLAALAVLIEHRVRIPRRVAADLSFAHPRKLSGTGFVRAAGHLGHCHVPGNDHTDPGTGFKGSLIRKLMKEFD